MGLDHFTAARDALDNFEFEEQRGDDLVVKEAIRGSWISNTMELPN